MAERAKNRHLVAKRKLGEDADSITVKPKPTPRKPPMKRSPLPAKMSSSPAKKPALSVKKSILPSKETLTSVNAVAITQCRILTSHAPHLGNHILMVFVGPNRDLVTLHTSLLPNATQHYISQVSAGLPTFQLPNEDTALFMIYRSWLYDQQLYTIADEDEETNSNGSGTLHKDAEWLRLAHCYLLGLNLTDEWFTNACLSAIVEKMVAVDTYPTGIAEDVYSFTQAGDKLRRLIVDAHVWKGLGQWIKAPHDDANGPIEFVHDVVNGMAEAGGDIYSEDSTAPWEEDLCAAYHWHKVSEKCKV